MHAQELARAFYVAVGQGGHIPDSTDLASAHQLIECYGFMEVGTLLPGVVTWMAAAPNSVPRLSEAIPYFAQVALQIAQSTTAKERSEREKRHRRDEEEQANAEHERDSAAFRALSRKMQHKLISDQREATPYAPEYFIERLAAKKARSLSVPASKSPNQAQPLEQWTS
jgi:hypothetical protein